MLLLNRGVDVGTSFMINEVLSTQSAQNFIAKLEFRIAARARLEDTVHLLHAARQDHG